MSNPTENANGNERSLEAAAIQTASSAVPAFIPSIIRHVTYPLKVSENIKTLESAVGRLDQAMEKDVSTVLTKKTLQNNNFPANTIHEWLQQANKVKGEAKHIIERYERRISFIHKLGPDYSISRKADKKLPEVHKLCTDPIIINLINAAQAAAITRR